MFFLSTNLAFFVVSFTGLLLNFRNILIILVGIEALLLSCNLNFVFFSVYLDDMYGQIFSLFILTVAASESAIGLAIIITLFRIRNNISLSNTALLKG
jgi:NADH-quinone oxidoreductase subunit K